MYTLFSVDDHIIEPADVWSSRVPAKFRETAPHVVHDGDREFWEYEGKRQPTLGLNAVAGKPREEWGNDPTRFADMLPGCYDPIERVKDLRSNGIYASVNFPTLPGFGGRKFVSFQDKELAMACVRAWNDFAIDEWCAAAPEVFVPMVITPLWDVSLCVAELQRCLNKGAKALCFVEAPADIGLPGFHTADWEPLFAVCQEADIPICMHVGSSGDSKLAAGSPPVVQIAAAFRHSATCSIDLMCSPLTRKYPNIKLVFSEGGIGWLPAALERADRQWERHKYWNDLDDTLPSEICRRSMFFCMIEEPWGLTQRDVIGVDNILFETDYPHSDTTWPHTQAIAKHIFHGVKQEAVDKIAYKNAEKLLKFPLTVPD
jgi:predicted TIM-barrel fold metal-dependent hydrolase